MIANGDYFTVKDGDGKHVSTGDEVEALTIAVILAFLVSLKNMGRR